MFKAYSDISIINKRPYIGYIIQTGDEVYTNRLDLSQSSIRNTPNQLEFIALEYLVQEIQQRHLKVGKIYIDSDFVDRSLSGKSEWFKKRAKRLNRTFRRLMVTYECISCKENLAHYIARGNHEKQQTLKIEIPLYNLSDAAFIEYRRKTKNTNVTKLVAQRKLTRNILLSIKGNAEKGVIKYRYGNLSIYVEGNTIIGVDQGDAIPGFRVNKGEYEHLNKLLYL